MRPRTAVGSAAETATHNPLRFLVLTLGSDCIAIASKMVRKILDYWGITRITQTLDSGGGIINDRGYAAPVMDLGGKLGLGAAVDPACTQDLGLHAGKFILLPDVNQVFGTGEVCDLIAVLAAREAAIPGGQSAA